MEKKLKDEIEKNKKLEEENKKLKNENEKLKSDLLNANKIVSDTQNNQINDTKIKTLKDENEKLKNQLNIKENEIKDLTLKIQNNAIIDKSKYDAKDIIFVTFISQDFSINEGVICLSTDIFAEVEEKFYKKYGNLRNTNNMFTVNAKPVLRFKKLSENRIKDGDTIEFFKLENLNK